MISVIIPNFNHRKYLPQRLESIFNQTLSQFEVIILDDCSTDGSWDYLRQFKNHPKVSHCLRNEYNSGSPFIQWRKGLELAKYDWIWIAESDDYSDTRFLEEVYTNRVGSCVLSFCSSVCVDKFGNRLKMNSDIWWGQDKLKSLGSQAIGGKEFILNYLLYRNSILNASSVVFKKPNKFPDKVLGMKYSGDWLFWVILLQSGEVFFLNKDYNYFRFHSNNTRAIASHSIEIQRYKEHFTCIETSRIKSNISYFNFNFQKGIKEMIILFFNLTLKKGRSKSTFYFPKIPVYYLPNYYFLLVKSFFNFRS